jgi:penicillin amidase
MRIVRALALAVLALAAVLVGIGLGALAWGYRSLPSWSGTVAVSGIEAPLRIVRDPRGIPHVFAAHEADAYFGLGYVHGQDRLWQLELDRRLASGQLAEIFGADALPRDRLFRTLGLRRAAEQSLAQLDPSTRDVVDAYVRGVNAAASQQRPLPPEFGLLGITPAAWTAVDSLVWLKMMAWMLSMNVDSELWRWRLSEQLSPSQIAEFLAPYPGEPPILLEGPVAPRAAAQHTGRAERRRGVDDRRGVAREGLGSNNWVVDGRNTSSGKPLLANDPHLGLTSPSIWYLAHLSAPGLNVIGGTMPSLPGVILGRNDFVAWAFTNTGCDIQDLFVERLAPGDPTRYVGPDGPLAFEVVREVIRVEGAPDEVLDVRISRHGPVISEVYEPAAGLTPPGHVLALGWTALTPSDDTPRFAVEAARARNAAEFSQAARHFQSPPQNMVYADTAGAVGFVAAGRMPVRGDNALRGLLPAPGWLREFDWQGFIPFERLPAERDPASGFIVTANQKIIPGDYPYWLGADWVEPYRADRIEARLRAERVHTLDGFASIQQDVHSGPARDLLPLLLAALPPESAGLTERERALLMALRGWNLEMRASSTEPLVFAAWVRQLARAIYADELGALFEEAWAERIGFLRNVLADRDGTSRWCDDVDTPRPEGCGECVLAAFRTALDDLDTRYGHDVSAWSWGEAHRARARHFPMTRVPLLRDLFDVVAPSDGGTHTVNVGAYAIDDLDAPFESRHAAGFRAIYDLGNPSASRFAISTGQSGHVLSPHYRDLVEPWQRGELASMSTDRTAIEAAAADVLVLEPSL